MKNIILTTMLLGLLTSVSFAHRARPAAAAPGPFVAQGPHAGATSQR